MVFRAAPFGSLGQSGLCFLVSWQRKTVFSIHLMGSTFAEMSLKCKIWKQEAKL